MPDRPQVAAAIPLTCQQIEQTLEECLDPVLSSRRTAEEPARGLTPLPRQQQEFVLHWTEIIQKSNSEMAYQFASHAPRALALMDIEGTRLWLLRAMDIYDQKGLYPGSAAFEGIEEFAREYRISHRSVSIDEVRPVLERFIRGLSGRDLKLEVGERSYTDTQILYLPARINRFDAREKNYQLYKATAVYLWAQSWFGTFRRPTPDSPHLVQQIAAIAKQHADQHGRALKLFNLLETVRLSACIRREFPGLSREMLALDATPPIHDATWKNFTDRLETPDATVADTLEATAALYPLQMPWPDALLYQGDLDLEAARLTADARIETEKSKLQQALSELLAANGEQEPGNSSFEIAENDGETGPGREIKLDGEALTMPPEIAGALASLAQDLGQLPEEWLTPAGDGAYDPTGEAPGQTAEEARKGDAQQEGAFLYDEWDFRRQNYRKNWCVLRELAAHPVYDDFIEHTLAKYLHLVAEIRRHFEALRDEDKLLKAQSGGDDIDLDALVTACADARTGVEMSERLFTRKNKVERDLAVIFMVDVSGSTKGWINDAERESLVLLCEALEALGDQYAIYGFSGMTRNRCEIYRIKTFDQPYDREVRARISGLRPRDYTRMGVTIRHLSKILNQVESRTRILITLSDGKPDDYDGYRGEYGIEDTRRALLEARHTGIHPFCITIDTEACDYLPHLYGHASYVVVDEVRKLPLKVADIYRKLTT